MRKYAYLILLSLTSCATTLDKLEQVGEQPNMAKTDNPRENIGYKPITWPTPDPLPPSKPQSNSLWQPGARAFFRDQRAARVGDILRVHIKIDDKAELNNETEHKRDTQDDVKSPEVFGLQSKLGILLPGRPNPEQLFDIKGTNKNKGTGTVQRQEKIETEIAALITQILPNGNFVIQGKQEIKVNFEVREIAISGVVRPEDIDTNNTINSAQVAEARITYGGHGQLTDVQQPRWGSQVIDVLSPF